ncbi:hypothetical protein EV426DRAFT_619004, partial [Tirmania nivea]
MVLSESIAATEKEKLGFFTNFMMDETTIRGARYSTAVGEEGGGAGLGGLGGLQRKGTFWGSGDYGSLYGRGAGECGKDVGEKGGVGLGGYESGVSEDDDVSDDGGVDGDLGGIGVELERELGILPMENKVQEEEVVVKPLFAGKKVERPAPHLGEGIMERVNTSTSTPTRTLTPSPIPAHEQKAKTPSPAPHDTIVPLSSRKHSFPPPIASRPATPKPNPLAVAKAIPDPLSAFPKPMTHNRQNSLNITDNTPPTPGVSQYKPFRPSTPTTITAPVKPFGRDISLPSPGVSGYQAYNPPTTAATSPKSPFATPATEVSGSGYRAYRPPSEANAAKRNSWVAGGIGAGALGAGGTTRPFSAIGGASAGYSPPQAPLQALPDRRMTMTTMPVGRASCRLPMGAQGKAQVDELGLLGFGGSGRGVVEQQQLMQPQTPKRTHTMAWDAAGEVVSHAHPQQHQGKPIGGFFALPDVGLGLGKGRAGSVCVDVGVGAPKAPPYPVEDFPPSFKSQAPQGQIPHGRTPSPGAATVARGRARAESHSQTPYPQQQQGDMSRASTAAPLPAALQTGTRSRDCSQGPVGYGGKSLSPQPQQGQFGNMARRESGSLSPGLAGEVYSQFAPPPPQQGGRRTGTPKQGQGYAPPPPQQKSPQGSRANASAGLSPAQGKATGPDSPSLRGRQQQQQPGIPRAISPGVQLGVGISQQQQPVKAATPVQTQPIMAPAAVMMEAEPIMAAPVSPKEATPVSQQQEPPSAPPASTPSTTPSTNNTSPALTTLLTLLPSTTTPTPSTSLSRTITLLTSLPPDFSFITMLTTEYTAHLNQTRQRSEEERRQRQEAHDKIVDIVDKAYTASEVGYGDLVSLDEEFKEREARLKEEEEAEEWRMFGERVVEPVTKRLEDEVKKLKDEKRWLVDEALESGIAGKEWWFGESNEAERKPGVGEVLRALLDVYAALEARYTKITDIQLEKTRREKKMVCTRMYERGEIKRMKETEKLFEKIEKDLLHKSAIEHKGRAEELQSVVDGGVMKGLEEELVYSEGVANAVKALLEEVPVSEEEVRERYAREKEWVVETEVALGKGELVLAEVNSRTVELFEVFHDAGLELARSEFEERLAGGKASGAVTKEEVDKWETLRKDEEGKLAKELDGRKGLVVGEWQGVRGQIGEALARVRKGMAKKEVPEKVQVQHAAQTQGGGKGVWGWF